MIRPVGTAAGAIWTANIRHVTADHSVQAVFRATGNPRVGAEDISAPEVEEAAVVEAAADDDREAVFPFVLAGSMGSKTAVRRQSPRNPRVIPLSSRAAGSELPGIMKQTFSLHAQIAEPVFEKDKGR